MSAHLFLKGAGLVEKADGFPKGSADKLTWAFRTAFFEQARDISDWDVQCAIAVSDGLDIAAIEKELRSGRAHASLASDYQDARLAGVEGSPSFVLNQGRQKLYGNVGYRTIEANIQELLREPNPDQASWC
jgi:predicted DsbA family dithiol-disulfide isomerase